MRRRWLLALVVVLIAGVLAATNPGDDRFHEWLLPQPLPGFDRAGAGSSVTHYTWDRRSFGLFSVVTLRVEGNVHHYVGALRLFRQID